MVWMGDSKNEGKLRGGTAKNLLKILTSNVLVKNI